MFTFIDKWEFEPRGRRLYNGWPRCAWGYDSQALIANVCDTAFVLEHVGVHIEFEIECVGVGGDDLGLIPPDDGLWVWTGKYEGAQDPEDASQPVGSFRPATDEEVLAFHHRKAVFRPPIVSPVDTDEIYQALVESRDPCDILMRLMHRDVRMESIREMFEDAAASVVPKADVRIPTWDEMCQRLGWS